MGAKEIETLLRSLIRGEFSSLTVSYNEVHACNYETAAQWAESIGASGSMQSYNDLRDWVSPQEREKALASNSVWSAQWYPETPIGFCQLYASSLDALLVGLAIVSKSE